MEKRLPQTKHWTRPSLRPTATLLGRLVVVVRLVVVRLVVVVLLVVVLCVVVLLVVVLLVVVLLVVVVVARVVVARVVVTTLMCFSLNFNPIKDHQQISILSTHTCIANTWHGLVSVSSPCLRWCLAAGQLLMASLSLFSLL